MEEVEAYFLLWEGCQYENEEIGAEFKLARVSQQECKESRDKETWTLDFLFFIP